MEGKGERRVEKSGGWKIKKEKKKRTKDRESGKREDETI